MYIPLVRWLRKTLWFNCGCNDVILIMLKKDTLIQLWMAQAFILTVKVKLGIGNLFMCCGGVHSFRTLECMCWVCTSFLHFRCEEIESISLKAYEEIWGWIFSSISQGCWVYSGFVWNGTIFNGCAKTFKVS